MTSRTAFVLLRTLLLSQLAAVSLPAQGSLRPAFPFPVSTFSGNTLGSLVEPGSQITGDWPHFLAKWHDGGAHFSASHDGGVTWSASTTLVASDSARVGVQGDYAFVLYRDTTSPSGTLRAHLSVDGGSTWTPSLGTPGTQINDPSGGVSIGSFDAAIVDDRVVAVWHSGAGVLSSDEAEFGVGTWGTDVAITSGVGGWCMAAAAGATSRAGILWVTSFSPSDLYFTSRSVGTAWSPAAHLATQVSANTMDLVASDTGSGVQFYALYIKLALPIPEFRFATESSSTPWSPSTIGTINSTVAWGAVPNATLAVARQSNVVHAFYPDFVAGFGYRVLHKEVWPSPSAVATLSGASFTSVVPDPRGVADGNTIACCWHTDPPGGSNFAEPVFNFSNSGVGGWRPNAIAFTSSAATSINLGAHVALSSGSLVATYREGSDLVAQGIVAYEYELAGSPPPYPQPNVRPSGLAVQDVSSSTTVAMSVTSTNGIPAVFITLGSSVYFNPTLNFCDPGNPSGSPTFIHWLYDLNVQIAASFPPALYFPITIPAGTNLIGAQINAQAVSLGDAGADVCFGLPWVTGPTAKLLITGL